MNNADLRAKAGRGSIVIENHDLFTNIEQDRFVSKVLNEKRFIYARFPLPLEQAYVAESESKRSQALAETLVLNALLVIVFGAFSLVLGASLKQMQWLLPSFAVLGVGLMLHKSQAINLFTQVYLVLLAACMGCSTYFLAMDMANNTWALGAASFKQSQSFELATLGFAVYSLSILAMAVRAPMEMPTLGFVMVAAGLSWFSADMMTLNFLFALMAITACAFWVWSEDGHRRDYLQRFAGSSAKAANGPKETERARQLVVLDTQTGLANNTSFMRFFSNEWQRAFRARQSVSLIMIHLGVSVEKLTEHGQLDKVLTELQRYSRRPGDLVGKVSANRFAVLLSNTDIANSRRLAESLLEHLHGLDLGKDGILKVYMGVASTLPMPNMTHEDLLHKAQDALDAAQEKKAN